MDEQRFTTIEIVGCSGDAPDICTMRCLAGSLANKIRFPVSTVYSWTVRGVSKNPTANLLLRLLVVAHQRGIATELIEEANKIKIVD